MYYRMTRLHFEDERFDAIAAWAETVRPAVERIDGFQFADLVRTGVGEGMIVAAYRDEAAFDAASETTSVVLGEMAELLTSPPHTHAGTVALSFGR